MHGWTADPPPRFAAALWPTVAVALADLPAPDSPASLPLPVAGPLPAAWLTGPRETVIVGIVAVVAGVVVGALESDFRNSSRAVGIFAVLVGGTLAVLVARAREAERAARWRTAL